jgi:hypothetical protein
VAQPDAGGPWSRFYTRVSTDHRLEQDFNSLDAQHEAAPAYIRSQAHARWTLIRSPYDDGGYSGGSTERPALQRLLAEVRGGKSTSLSSTRSIGSPDHWLTSPSSWNLFDAHAASFVSVAQQFKTGRTIGGIPFTRGPLGPRVSRDCPVVCDRVSSRDRKESSAGVGT